MADTAVTPVRRPWTYERRPCMVYAFYDERDDPVYVGVTLNIAKRLASHMAGPFWSEVHRIETWRFLNTYDAHEEERRLIAHLGPRWNIQDNDPFLAEMARERRKAASNATA